MSKNNIYPLLILGTYILLLCSSLAYISFAALGAEYIIIDVYKHSFSYLTN
ncbi:hypothetical protein [Lysinibacillus xylanilyticus]|uniref:hypothetical protein n=1 Tax=Lysinibacillus xylanilyticus TaxID=582475 RepID=UPI0012FD6201|nr:hypothetical protein [Lysinibacillus xylanilyticus]